MIETLRRWRPSLRAALVVVTLAILLATSAIALWQRDRVREELARSRRMASADDPEIWPALQRSYELAAGAARRRQDAAEARAWLERAVELGERRMAVRPSAAAARALARALGQLAELARRAGEIERSEQQGRRALQLLRRALDDELRADPRGGDEAARLRLELARALAALGDLEMQRQRRAGARGYYDRAWASALEGGDANGDARDERAAVQRLRRRALLDVGLRRLGHGLAEPALCVAILRELVALELLDEATAADPEPDPGAEPDGLAAFDPWRDLEALLGVCPRFPDGDRAMASWLAAQLAEMAETPATSAAGEPPPHAALLDRLRRAAAGDAAVGPP